MLQLHCTRSKLFIHHNGERTEKAVCTRGMISTVPDWVKNDIGYAAGIKDKSIVDLTPPKAVAQPPAPVEESVEESVSVDSDLPGSTEPTNDLPGPAETVEEKPAPRRSTVPKGLQGGSTVVKTK